MGPFNDNEGIRQFHDQLKFQPGLVIGDYARYMDNLQLFPSQYAYVVSVAEGMLKAHKGFDKVLGYKNEEINLLFVYNLFHPDDRLTMHEVAAQTFRYALSISSFPFEGEFMVDYRVRKVDDTYIRVLRQSTTLESDEHGKTISTISVCTDISFLKAEGEIMQKMNFKASKKYEFKSGETDKHFKLTKREADILRLIAEGKDSLEIADKLHISVHTVRTHRRNLLTRSGLGSMIQLINLAKKRNLI